MTVWQYFLHYDFFSPTKLLVRVCVRLRIHPKALVGSTPYSRAFFDDICWLFPLFFLRFLLLLPTVPACFFFLSPREGQSHADRCANDPFTSFFPDYILSRKSSGKGVDTRQLAQISRNSPPLCSSKFIDMCVSVIWFFFLSLTSPFPVLCEP